MLFAPWCCSFLLSSVRSLARQQANIYYHISFIFHIRVFFFFFLSACLICPDPGLSLALSQVVNILVGTKMNLSLMETVSLSARSFCSLMWISLHLLIHLSDRCYTFSSCHTPLNSTPVSPCESQQQGFSRVPPQKCAITYLSLSFFPFSSCPTSSIYLQTRKHHLLQSVWCL